MVGLAGERGYEINVSALGRFLEVSSGLTTAELTDAQLDAVAGGLTEGSLVFKMLDTISDSATDDSSAM